MSTRFVRPCLSLASLALMVLAAAARAAPPSYLGLEPVPAGFGVTATGFTIECWMKMRTIAPTPYSRNPRVLHCIDPGSSIPSCGDPSSNAWDLSVAIDGHIANRIVFGMSSSGSCSGVVSEVPVFDPASPPSFHHVAATYDGTTMRIYVDGVPRGELVCAGRLVDVTGGRMRVGNPVSGPPLPDIDAAFDGVVDEIRIWRVARTAGQIAANMNAEISPLDPDLVSYWRLNGDFVDLVDGRVLGVTGDVTFGAGPSGSFSQAANILHEGTLTPGNGSVGSYCQTTPPAPVLASPANGATGVATSPALTWNGSAGATTYRVQVSTDPGFATIVADQGNLAATSFAPSGLAGFTTYYWHVNANGAGGESNYSAAWSFTTGAPSSQQSGQTAAHRPDIVQVMPQREMDLRAYAVQYPADTAWIGHVNTNTGLPGTPFGYGPYRIGRGVNRIVGGVYGGPASFNGVWDFDNFQAGEVDSLQGWWPILLPYNSAGMSNLPDGSRPFFCLDYGNQGNYVINQGAPKRTFGVTGYWHRDGGSSQPPVPAQPSHNPAPLTWTPISGSASAWCGLRSHGDVAALDAVSLGGTGNAFNQSVLEYSGPHAPEETSTLAASGTVGNFPGYGSQWDQMLYRDVVVGESADFSLSFKYSTNMSGALISARQLRAGWFDKDPLKPVTPSDANFISSSLAGANAPVDSFMVYVGIPVNESGALRTDGTIAPVHDPKRRWLSEVVKINSTGMESFYRIFSVSGINATATVPIFIPASDPRLQAIKSDDGPGNGGTVRLVFRVKTNRGFDDQDHGVSGFSSGTAGAAIIDDVVVNGWAPSNGAFEAPGSINNDPAVPATSAWKSTGKPPGLAFHAEDLTTLVYDDPCGSFFSPSRICNMGGRVVTPGDHDLSEKPGGVFGSNDTERRSALASPTINLRSVTVGDFNGMGIDAEIAARDIVLWFDVFQSLYSYMETGLGYRVGWQSYPATQANGVKCWGEVMTPPQISTVGGAKGCVSGFGGRAAGYSAKADQLIVTSNLSGIPDSIRCFIEVVSRCYTVPLTAGQCAPTSGLRAGGYFDNLSIGFVSGAGNPGMTVAIWDWLNDAFPANSSVQPLGPRFDTTAAYVGTGFNASPQTGNLQRHNIPGDSLVVRAPGADVRLDLVFRILPGVGNYVTVGDRGSGVISRPDIEGTADRLAGKSVPGDASFWGQYLGSNGLFGTPGGHPAGVWDPNTWNSARMDTAEINLFPVNQVALNLGRLAPGHYSSQYHELDPKFVTLGIVKNRCFLVATTPGSPTDASNVTCGAGVFPPMWTGSPGSGSDPNEVPGQPGKTREYTKIIPDGLLTPGAHVQYFLRRSDVTTPTSFSMLPDTNFVWPQIAEGSFDGHRWQQFSVLPDRWKDPAFGGTGMAAMLVVDLGDRRGDELAWVSIADSLGLTAAGRRGAHNGWRATGNQAITGNVGGDDAIAVRPHLGQPGTTWDLYQVRGGESNSPAGRLGSRGSSQAGAGLAAGKFSRLGPTGAMLRNYRAVMVLASDLGVGLMGPYVDQSDDDVGVLNDYISNPSGSPTPRALQITGRDFIEGQNDYTTGHAAFFAGALGATFRSGDYRILAGAVNDVVDLTAVPPVSATPTIYGVSNPCFGSNDVFEVNAETPGAQAVAYYEDNGFNGPFVAGVHVPWSPSRPTRTIVEGWTLGGTIGSRFTLGRAGMLAYWFRMLSNLYADLGAGPQGPPVGVGDVPGGEPAQGFAYFSRLASSNPMGSRGARIAFGLARTELAELRVFDVQGRLVRTLANRVFPAGEHVVTWDGTNDSGQKVAGGVYFYRVRTPFFASNRKIVLLSR